MSLGEQDCRVGMEPTASYSREAGMWKVHTGLTLPEHVQARSRAAEVEGQPRGSG